MSGHPLANAPDQVENILPGEARAAGCAKTDGLPAGVARTDGIPAGVARTDGLPAGVARTDGLPERGR